MCATYCQEVNPFKHIQTIFFIIPTPNILYLQLIRAPKVNRSNPKSGFLQSVGLILQRLLGISITFGLRGCGGAWLQKKRFQTVLRQDFRCFKVQVSRFTVFRASNVPEFQGLIVSSCTVKGFQVPKAAAPSGVGITVRNVLEFLEFFFPEGTSPKNFEGTWQSFPIGIFSENFPAFFFSKLLGRDFVAVKELPQGISLREHPQGKIFRFNPVAGGFALAYFCVGLLIQR